MKSVTMTKRHWRITLDLMEQNEEGYDRPTRRRFNDRIAPQMEEAMGDYYSTTAKLIKEAMSAARQAQAAGEPVQVIQRINARADIDMEALDLNGGQEPATICFEDSDFTIVKASMPEKKLRGAKLSRELGIAIEDAIDAAKEVVPQAVRDEAAAKKNGSSNGDDKRDSAGEIE